MSYFVNLIRQRNWTQEKNVWVDTFEVDDKVEDAEKAARNAVKEFLATSLGEQVTEDNGGDFNWGDAIVHVPNSIWAKHGLTLERNDKVLNVMVAQDENLQKQ